MKNILSTKNLTFDYIRRDDEGNVEGITTAVDDVTLDVQEGDFIAILGANGSGKSTLAKHICGTFGRVQVWCSKIPIIR